MIEQQGMRAMSALRPVDSHRWLTFDGRESAECVLRILLRALLKHCLSSSPYRIIHAKH